MRTLIIACRTLEDELRLAIAQTGVVFPVLFWEAGLHLKPELLRERIQQDIDRIENIDVLLMAYGICGKGLMGIKSSHCRIIVPRVHDCISLLLGSGGLRDVNGGDTYYVTKGWLTHELSLLGGFHRSVARYGEQRAIKTLKSMMKHYTKVATIDTGAYSLEEITPRVEMLAEKLGWRHEVVSGSLRMFHKLLVGPWDDEFIVLEPGQEITLKDIVL